MQIGNISTYLIIHVGYNRQNPFLSKHPLREADELYQKLRTEALIQPWLNKEELYPGQDWNMDIEKAV